MKRAGTAAVQCLIVLSVAATQTSAQSRCAECHLANPTAPAVDHLTDWDLSAHKRANVGCEKCHGGNATTFEPLVAHRGMLNSGNPASPVNRRNIPTTCGTCHAGPFVAFQKSQHFALLKKGDTRVPVCSLCHGAAGFWRPTGKSLETECRQCHGARGTAPRPERAEAARLLYEDLHETRGAMKSAASLVRRVKDKARRAQLESVHQQAEVPLVEAIRAGHQFVYDDMKERLATARRRLDALLEQFANPKP